MNTVIFEIPSFMSVDIKTQKGGKEKYISSRSFIGNVVFIAAQCGGRQ